MKTNQKGQLQFPELERALGKITEIRCRIRPSKERREHAGGTPAVALEFHDQLGEQASPIAVDQFNWDEVSSAVDVTSDIDGEERVESLRQLTFRMAAYSMRDLLDWVDEEVVTPGGKSMTFDTSRRIKDNILRNYVRNEGLTCEQIGLRVGISKQHVSHVKQDFEDRFQVFDAHSKTAEQKEASREAQLARRKN